MDDESMSEEKKTCQGCKYVLADTQTDKERILALCNQIRKEWEVNGE